ncbi:MAG: nucleoside triphosphate pyrophosphohydrolase [Clostridia bacterium]|nr:nucleoside triphosphate pyrophosphohydrolase [Clostridia bacterium]
MKKLTVVPLSTRDNITVAALDAIKSADRLYLQTKRHPCANAVLELGLDFSDMDDLYDAAEDFDKLNEAIADRLTGGDSCVYAVIGDLGAAQAEPIQRRCKERGFVMDVLPCVPCSRAAFPHVSEGITACAVNLPKRLNPELPLIITELDNRYLAGEIKLRLMEYYPDSHIVELALMGGDGRYSTESMELFRIDHRDDFNELAVLHVPRLEFSKRERFSYYDLVETMRRLRGRDGCPWDREQTHESLKRDLLEECYELLDAIDEKDDDHIIEELGDVLMLIVFHGMIAEEQSRFNDLDISSGIVNKLIYRHPHIFSNAVVHNSDEVLKNWDALKAKEKDYKTQAEILRSVPKNFPALMRAQKVQKKAAKAGFDWDNAKQAFYKLPEETQELERAVESGEGVEEELGDLLFTAVNLVRLMGLDSEDVMHGATEKFIDRYERMEQLAAAEGVKIETLNLEEQDKYWERAKKSRK